MTNTEEIFFSIIIPTRNRVGLFKEALDSVVGQSFMKKEIVVVNDGSTGADLEDYKALETHYPEVNFHYLVHRSNGHGQSYSMNYGASQARGQYLCFLDDDDYWTDNEHLARAYGSLINTDTSVDVYYTNQDAFYSNGKKNVNNPWIADLEGMLQQVKADGQGSKPVDAATMLKSTGFAHLNCSIFRNDFYHQIKGMDENIRYECDRDIYIRAIDSALLMLYNPATISYHRVPDPKNSTNMSTMVSDFQKRLYQLNVYEKGILFAQLAEIRQFCSRGKGYQLKAISESFKDSGNLVLSAQYARQALGVLPTVKWLFYTVYISIRALFSDN